MKHNFLQITKVASQKAFIKLILISCRSYFLIWKDRFSDIRNTNDIFYIKNMIFWYQEFNFWRKKINLNSWCKKSILWHQKNIFSISRIRICDIKTWFSDITKYTFWCQKLCFDIKNYFLISRFRIIDIKYLFFDITKYLKNIRICEILHISMI